MTSPGADFWSAGPPVRVPVPGTGQSVLAPVVDPAWWSGPPAPSPSVPAPVAPTPETGGDVPFEDLVTGAGETPQDLPAPAATATRSRSWRTTARTVVGELLVTAAVLTGMYVGWLLWWTDVEGVAAQEQIVADLGWAGAPDAEPSTRPEKHSGEGPDMADPGHAETFAVLYVPRWGQDYARPISEGVDRATVLDPKGVGHYPGTALPGQVGNFAIAGHRVTYGKPFNRVEELQVGDPIVVQTEDAWFVYRVTGTQVVSPRDVDVIAPDPTAPGAEATEQRITLTTCHPMYSARERFVVTGDLDYWWPADQGAPGELTGQEA